MSDKRATVKLTPELWLQLQPLLTTGLELAGERRDAWLAQVDKTHPGAAPMLRRMLATHDRAERRHEMETVPKLAAGPRWTSTHAAGAVVGPFELLAPLGQGGMGEVWRARQADGRVEREVALKLPAMHQQGAVWRERFRRERDILARLVHPNIARLYDAGITPAGQPWLAMEYVQGLSLSAHVASRAHSTAERLALFRQVLAAVAHAHRHLVVHRDLKPANILIDTSGQVKLLDFGIAKLVGEGEAEGGDGGGDLTRLGGRVMTLRYAAPEQVSAGAITTATDVYALGVILHELLTGVSPYRAVRDGKPLTDVLLVQEAVAVPSRLGLAKPLARELAGDLDSIILKALRHDPADRYACVEAFDADLVAHLQSRPVAARAGTWRYLAGRYVARHKLPLAAAAAIVATLIAGVVMAERERRIAVAEKARAERHFASVRKLANTFIFDVHHKIETLPGSLEAREMLIATSLEYLDALSSEAPGDAALMFEMASAYRNIGNIQGQAGAANQGALLASIGNLEKSKRLFVALERMHPADVAAAREHRKLSYSLARGYFMLGDARWQAEIADTVRLASIVSAAPGASAGDRHLRPLMMLEQAHLASLTLGPRPGLERTMAESIAAVEALAREAPEDLDLSDALSGAYLRLGRALAGPGHTPQRLREALAYLERARALASRLRARFPDDVGKATKELDVTLTLAFVQAMAGDVRAADRTPVAMAPLAAALGARDPTNVDVLGQRMAILVAGTEVALQAGDAPRSVRVAREALALAPRYPEQARKSREVRGNVARAKAFLGYGLIATSGPAAGTRGERLARLLEARALLAEVSAYLVEHRAQNLGELPADEIRRFEAEIRRCDEAIAKLRAA
jgi:tetratricopeptide (TPR) repeat protein